MDLLASANMDGQLKPILFSTLSANTTFSSDHAEIAVDPKRYRSKAGSGSIYTIGHALAGMDNSFELLHDIGITILADVRSFPEKTRKAILELRSSKQYVFYKAYRTYM